MHMVRSALMAGLLTILAFLFAACAVPQQGTSATQERATAGASGQEPADAAGSTTFRIVPEESEARFTISEVLLGTAQTVVGATQDVSGEITLNSSSPLDVSIGVIEINADSFVTDNERRNTAIRRFILQTSSYPTITFTPTTLGDMPNAVAVGDRVSLQVSGDLQIRELVNPVTFDVTVDVVSTSELSGSARAVLQRADYDLSIPSVPSVTDVSEEVGLELDFVARAE